MKLLVTADFHGSIEAACTVSAKAKQLGVDIITICGDITHFGTVKDAERILAPLIALKLPTLYVPGNCDPAQLAEVQIAGAFNLHGQCKNFNHVSFIGVGGAPASPYYSWFELSETQITNTLEQSVSGCSTNRWLVVISHSPPRDTAVDLASSGDHAGSTSIRAFIEDKKPSVVFCGHIHEATGIDRIGNTIVVNSGSARHGKCAVADLNDRIEVKLLSI